MRVYVYNVHCVQCTCCMRMSRNNGGVGERESVYTYARYDVPESNSINNQIQNWILNNIIENSCTKHRTGYTSHPLAHTILFAEIHENG